MDFKKPNIPIIDKPKEEVKKEVPKTMLEALQQGGYSLEQTKQELINNGLTDRESNAFIDIFVNQIHYSEVAKKYSIKLTELMTLHSKFSILAIRYGVDANKIINMLK